MDQQNPSTSLSRLSKIWLFTASYAHTTSVQTHDVRRPVPCGGLCGLGYLGGLAATLAALAACACANELQAAACASLAAAVLLVIVFPCGIALQGFPCIAPNNKCCTLCRIRNGLKFLLLQGI